MPSASQWAVSSSSSRNAYAKIRWNVVHRPAEAGSGWGAWRRSTSSSAPGALPLRGSGGGLARFAPHRFVAIPAATAVRTPAIGRNTVMMGSISP